jgi:hypothetical protein
MKAGLGFPAFRFGYNAAVAGSDLSRFPLDSATVGNRDVLAELAPESSSLQMSYLSGFRA